MKRNLKFKRVFTFFLSIVLLVSTIYTGIAMFGNSVSAAAEEMTSSVSYAEKKVLSEENYDSAVIYNPSDPDRVWDAHYAFQDSSQAIFPVADPLGNEGRALMYKQSVYEDGAVYLGADYESASQVKSQAVRVTPGAAYAVRFDYYTAGNTGNMPLKLELTAGNTIDTGSAGAMGDKKITSLTTGAVQVLNIDSDTDLTMGGWITANATITIPKDTDTGRYTYLMLRVTYGGETADGSRGAIYFDNVKVVEAFVANAGILAEADFSDANDTADDMYNHSLAFRSGTDPLNEGNRVMARVSGYDYGGAVYLGMDYKDDTTLEAIDREAIKVEAGKTYTVQFDYYYDCTEFAKESPVYLTAGKTAVRDESLQPWSGKYEIAYDEAVAVTAFTTQANQKLGGWTTARVSITFPKDYDTDAYPYLILYNNSRNEYCKLYIDNIKVLEPISSNALQVYDEQLCFNDYSDANVTLDDTYNHSLAFRPDTDPVNDGNTVLARVSGYDYGSAVYLGMDYKDDTTSAAIDREAIKVEAGKTYTVQFDYYYDCTDFGKESPVYLTAGKTAVRDENQQPWTGRYEIAYDEAMAVTAFTTQAYQKLDGWVTARISITFPDDYDTAAYPYLILYNNSCNEYCKLYIDNTEVKVSAPLAVNYTIDGKTSCQVFDSGIMDHAAFNQGKNAVVWYSDKACTQLFQYSGREKLGGLEIFELYGVYEDATAVLMKGDVDLNHTVDKNDMTAMRRWLTGSAGSAVAVRADFDGDSNADVRDLVRMKKFLEGNVLTDFTINGNPLANYTIVTPTAAGYDYGVVTSRINELADIIKTENNRTNVDVIKEDYQPETECEIIIGSAARDGVTTGLAKSSYIVTAAGTKLYVNGGSENALGAAIEALMGCIRLGNSINEENFIEFEYISDTELTNPALTVLSEDFDIDVEAGAMRNHERNPYWEFFGKKDPYDFFIDNRVGEADQTWYTAFSTKNISASGGKLILDASGLQEISFTEGNVITTHDAYIGAEVRGQFFTYGYAEIYAKLDVCSGVCPAFWLLGSNEENCYYEIDVFECLGAASQENGMIKSSLIEHKWNNNVKSTKELRTRYEVATSDGYKVLGEKEEGNWEKCYFDGFGNDGKFHKYAVEWTEDFIYFLYDDERVMRMQLQEGEFSGAMCPILTIYSGVDVKDGIHQTGSPEGVTDEEWANSSSFEVEYMKIYSKQFAKN